MTQLDEQTRKRLIDANLASKPYACYDMETNEWLQKPKPFDAKFYGEAFMLVMPKAEDIAIQAEAHLGELDRNTTNWQFWTAMYNKYQDEKYLKIAQDAQDKATLEKEGVATLFQGVFGGRAQAYSPEGKGVNDERDLIQKLLEVWGIFQELKHYARAPLPWEDHILPNPPIPKGSSLWAFA